jgi:hypothetical protein
MANNNASVISIDLKSQLITTQNKNAILPFNGFKKRNSPFLNGGLKHFNLEVSNKQLLDRYGNKYRIENGHVYKNDVVIKDYTDAFIKVKELEMPTTEQLGLSENILYITPLSKPVSDEMIYFYFVQTENYFYLFKKESNTYSQLFVASGTFKLLTSARDVVAYNYTGSTVTIIAVISNYYPVKQTFTLDKEITDAGLNWVIRSGAVISGATKSIFLARTVPANNTLFDVDPTDTSNIQYFWFSLPTSASATVDSGTGNISNNLFFEQIYLINPIPDIKNTIDTSNLEIDEENVTVVLDNLKERGRASYTFTDGVIIAGTYQNKAINFPSFKGQMYHNVSYDGESGMYDVGNTLDATYYKFECKGAKILIGDDFIKYSNYIAYTPMSREFVHGASYETEEEAAADYSLYVNTAYNPHTRGDTRYFTDFYDGDGNIILGGGCTTGTDDATFSENFVVSYVTGSHAWNKVYTANGFAGISWKGKLIENWLSIQSDYVRPILSYVSIGVRGLGFLYCKNDKWYTVDTTAEATIKLIYGRYLLVLADLGTDVYNCYDTVTNTWFNFASDWNNRILIGARKPIDWRDSTYSTTNEVFSIEIASGENVNWTRGNISSALWQPVIYNHNLLPAFNNNSISDYDFITNFIRLRYNNSYGLTTNDIKQSIELYYSAQLNGKSTVETPYYVANYNNYNILVDEMVAGKIFPLATDGNIIFNIPLTTEFIQTAFNYYVKNGDNYYQLITQNSAVILCYAYGTTLEGISEMFNLQGIPYIIQNNFICSCVISENVVSNILALINCQFLRFLGASLDKAYFYSEADKKIYVFSGDRRLNELCEYSNIGEIVTSFFSVFLNTFFIVVEDKVICITNDEYIYEIDGAFTDYQELEKGIAFFTETLSYYYSIYDTDNAQKIEAETAFYGVGENKVSIIDTWFIKLYSAGSEKGSIKLKVTSLTDKGTQSEETEFKINSDMWDEMTHTYYLRYQPKLQRGIGVSLAIESDFDLIDLKCSYNVDNNVSQLSKPFSSTNMIVGGKI